MCIERVSGMKFVFLKSVFEFTSQGEKATPAKIAKSYNMTYRHIIRIAIDLEREDYIEINRENWRIEYGVTQRGLDVICKTGE